MKQRLLNLTEKERYALVNEIIHDYDDERDLGLSEVYDINDSGFYEWWFDDMEAFDDEFSDEDGYVYWEDFNAFLKRLEERGSINLSDKYVYISFYGDLITSCNDPYEVLSPDEIIEIVGDKLLDYLKE